MDKLFIENLNDILIIHILGNISKESSEQIERTWNDELSKQPNIIAIDFSKIDYVDSVGLFILIKLYRTAIQKEVQLVLFGLNETIKKLFNVIEFHRYFNIMSSVQFYNDNLIRI